MRAGTTQNVKRYTVNPSRRRAIITRTRAHTVTRDIIIRGIQRIMRITRAREKNELSRVTNSFRSEELWMNNAT